MHVCHVWDLGLSFHHVVPRSSNLGILTRQAISLAHSTELQRAMCNYLQAVLPGSKDLQVQHPAFLTTFQILLPLPAVAVNL